MCIYVYICVFFQKGHYESNQEEGMELEEYKAKDRILPLYKGQVEEESLSNKLRNRKRNKETKQNKMGENGFTKMNG